MPVQKGKHNRRPRRRGPAPANFDSAPPSGGAVPVARKKPPARRRGLGKRGNALMGLVMVLVGGYFFAFPSARVSPTVRIVFLVAYLGVASFYLAKAYRQHRAGE